MDIILFITWLWLSAAILNFIFAIIDKNKSASYGWFSAIIAVILVLMETI